VGEDIDYVPRVQDRGERRALGRTTGDWVARGNNMSEADLYSSFCEERVYKQNGSLHIAILVLDF
jgi:hypothetical protein